jgi:hypothetical protein
MQMGMAHESVESLLLALTNFPAADIAKCPPNLIEKAKHLLQDATVPSPASSPRTQDEEGLVHVTVPSSASPPRTQDEEGLVHVTTPSSAPPPGTRDEAALESISVPEDVPISNGHTSDPVDAGTAVVETKANKVFQALLKAIKRTEDLLKQDVKEVICGDLSPAAYDPCVQDLEACIGAKPSDPQKLRHIIVLPEWLKAYEDFESHSHGRGTLSTFSAQRGLKYETVRNGIFRARRLRYITKCFGRPGLEAPLGLIVSKWRSHTEEVLLVVARLCQEDSSVTEAMPALLKFYEECHAEYTVLLYERLTAVQHAVKFTFLKWTRGFVEVAEVEEPPIDEGQYGCVSVHENPRLSTEGVGCQLSTTVARRKNQHGVKRSFDAFEETYASSEDNLSVSQYSDDVSLHTTRPSSVCTGSTAGMDA